MRDHKQLRAFQLADDLALAVYKATHAFPTEEQYGLRSQIRRCAVSVPSNIVEGCGRSSTSDFIRFLDIAFGSLRELGYHLDLSHRLGFLRSDDYESCKGVLIETDKVLAALIRAKRDSLNS